MNNNTRFTECNIRTIFLYRKKIPRYIKKKKRRFRENTHNNVSPGLRLVESQALLLIWHRRPCQAEEEYVPRTRKLLLLALFFPPFFWTSACGRISQSDSSLYFSLYFLHTRPAYVIYNIHPRMGNPLHQFHRRMSAFIRYHHHVISI